MIFVLLSSHWPLYTSHWPHTWLKSTGIGINAWLLLNDSFLAIVLVIGLGSCSKQKICHSSLSCYCWICCCSCRSILVGFIFLYGYGPGSKTASFIKSISSLSFGPTWIWYTFLETSGLGLKNRAEFLFLLEECLVVLYGNYSYTFFIIKGEGLMFFRVLGLLIPYHE